MSMYSLMIQHVILVVLSLVVSLGSAAGSSSVQPLCHTDERHALLSFKASFTILSSDCGLNFPICVTDSRGAQTRSWKSGVTDCCQWDGVTCDPLTGHVTELHLSHSFLNGSFPSNSTLFSLRRLHHIDLSFNHFLSPIPSGFGRLSDLTYLNLASSGFSGQVPPEIGWLSSLTTLDLSSNYVNGEPLLKMPNFKTVIANITNLRELHLSFVSINADLPPLIANFSNLTSLKLDWCDLQGEFLATGVLSLPNLHLLDLGSNSGLHADFSASVVKWTSPLEVVDLSYNNFTGKLPDSIGDSTNSSLISFAIRGCGFHGRIPGWMWKVTKEIDLGGNKLSGSLPGTMNTIFLARLSTISLDGNSITGAIPAWLFTLPSLTYLSLDENLFTGINQFVITNSSAPLFLSGFSASYNQFRGKIPEAIFELRNLQSLSLEGNNLNVTIPLSKLHGLQNLGELSLSDNNISFIDDIGAESISSWPSFWRLELSSCNLDQFPIFLRGQKNLEILDLSKNSIHSPIPEWFVDINTALLLVLDLSHNFLTGGLEHLQRQEKKDYSMGLFLASNNQFSGDIPSSLCHLTSFHVVDISQNNLTGNIPGCFASIISSQTSVLDLSQNQLQGVIPSTIFEDCTELSVFRLKGNRLEGPIPKSLRNCMNLQFIDLSNNKLNGTFPNWLGALPTLKGLILGSNNLQGSLMSSNTTSSFFMLKILDISSNHLTGGLPSSFFMSMKAMIEVDHSDQDRSIYDMDALGIVYSGGNSNYSYADSMNAWFKGFNHRLDKILKTLVLIDASRNRLEGSIPEAIGDLVSLRWLNLAHNNFTGHIPPSLGKLNLLESLDMSFNGLDGKIPNELVNLNSLEFFNVSKNHLAGPIPAGKQLDTFSNDSYLGNPGLCGAPLTKKCGKQVAVPNAAAAEGNSDGSSSFDVWEIALMGFGFGMFVASVWGYFILWEKNYRWVCRLMLEVQMFIMLHLMRRR